MNAAAPPCTLTIAGSDSGGGAGIQADLKTFAAHRVHGLTAITALTAQNTRGVRAVNVPPATFLRQQIDACFEDFDVGAVKIGMLANAAVVHAVADALAHWNPRWIVLDPVLVATSGAQLFVPDALDALRIRLLPMASLLTPNIPEAERLLGYPVADARAADAALDALLRLGPAAVLLKGGHLPFGGAAIDRFADGESRACFSHPRLDVQPHGAGCTLAAAACAGLATGLAPLKACENATDYVHGALRNSYRPPRSKLALLDHFWRDTAHHPEPR